MLPSFWFANTKPGPRSSAAKAGCLGKGERGSWRRVIARQK